MPLSLSDKTAAFCRETADPTLRELAEESGMTETFRRAVRALQALDDNASSGPGEDRGPSKPTLEEDLDALDALARARFGQGYYPTQVLSYTAPPGTKPTTGARHWACPHGRCAGRGRVRPGQQPPLCTGTGAPLVSTAVEA
ncbi:hypothetical protein OG988_00825 [Streptomyces zaomyceticus]|uniref:hypothetical protein n=1 Tax=Streptomyces zaomyceticus TaxID=68286 RepID=UPI0032556222